MRRAVALSSLALLFVVPSFALADVRLPKIFGDNMVLQQGKPVPVWGWAEAGEKVVVTFAGKTVEGVPDAQGKWLVKLPELTASAEPQEFTVTGKNTVTFKNVLVGEVWICSGQSNMEWPVAAALNPEQEIKGATYPQIRLISVAKPDVSKVKNEPQTDFAGAWVECQPETVKGFSAIGYFFGKEIHTLRKVPVGLINTSFGGTPAEYWTPPSAFAADPTLKTTSEHPHSKAVMTQASVLYNHQIHPLVPYAVAGVVWYQGESNVPMGKLYQKMFSGMIQGWRKEWGQGDFPFLYVQIAPWVYDRIESWPRTGAPLVREGQLKTLATVPNVGMTVTMDIGDVNDIHPKNKQEVSRRLSLAARALAYGETTLEFSGPLFKAAVVEGNKIAVTFDHAKGLKMTGDALKSFEIAGADKKFVEAKATIEGERVVVTSEKVAEPKFVRFAFTDDAQPNLFNSDGLPASPFRTDED